MHQLASLEYIRKMTLHSQCHTPDISKRHTPDLTLLVRGEMEEMKTMKVQVIRAELADHFLKIFT